MGDQGHLGAQTGHGLRQFTADRTSAQHQQAARQFTYGPERVGSQKIDIRQTGNIRNPGPRPAGDNDVAGANALAVDVHFPGGHQPGVSGDAVHAEGGKAFDRVMRLDGGDFLLHALHDLREIHGHLHRGQAESGGATHLIRHMSTAQQRFARNASRVQTVAAHLVALDQGNFGFQRRRDQCGHQARRTRADHHQIGIELFGPGVARQAAPRVQALEQGPGHKGKRGQQRERAQQGGGEDTRAALELPEPGARVHVNGGGRQHAELRYPVKTQRADRQQARNQVDHKERKHRHQAQREQIKRAVASEALIERAKLAGKALLNPVPQQGSRDQKRQRGA